MWELVFFVSMSLMAVVVFASKASEPAKAIKLGIIPTEKLSDCVAPNLDPAPVSVTPQQLLYVHQHGVAQGRQQFLHQLYNPSMN